MFNLETLEQDKKAIDAKLEAMHRAIDSGEVNDLPDELKLRYFEMLQYMQQYSAVLEKTIESMS